MQTTLDFIQIILLITLIYLVSKKLNLSKVVSKSKNRKLVMDTCALIDGRILDIANAGFMQAELIIPSYVVNELQLLADGQDAHKRERARFGLDVIQELQKAAHITVTTYTDDDYPKLPTDNRLVKTAHKLSADLCTIDYNLNKVATIDGVRVLNVNELAKAIRPVALPGERLTVKIVQKGSNKDQGVGYLEDGSMIVVEGAARAIGKVMEVEISRYIQTDAGKMLFARKLK